MQKQKILFFITFIIALSGLAYACGGSCLECHPKLAPFIQDKDHEILNTCTTCHDRPSERGLCGQDCFECHPKEKFYANATIKEHQAIKACSACHIEKANFVVPKQSISPNQNNLIQLFK